VHDEISSIDATDRMYRFFCARGTSVQYTRDAVPDVVSVHAIVSETSGTGAFSWLAGVLDGTAPAQAGCSEQTVPSTAVGSGWRIVLPPMVDSAAKVLLGLPVG
jgi:hypothetical protein